MFVDDFEKVLKERYEQPIQLADNSSRIYVEKYFSKKMLVTINGKVESIKLIGTEIEDDMVHCYFEIENISNINTIQITNKLFFDMFDNQQNITHLKVNNRKKSFLFIEHNATGVLKF